MHHLRIHECRSGDPCEGVVVSSIWIIRGAKWFTARCARVSAAASAFSRWSGLTSRPPGILLSAKGEQGKSFDLTPPGKEYATIAGMKDRVWIIVTGLLGTALVLGMHLSAGSHFYITEREWQTAMTAWWMAHGHAGLFSAWLPLMGPPWRIPMELPIFQALATTFQTPFLSLEDSGRGVSFLFFLLNAFLLYHLIRELEFPKHLGRASVLLYLSSPLVLSYAFSFTIEMTAIFLGLLFILTSIRWVRRGSWISLMIATLAGMLGACAKSTTWAVMAAFVGILLLGESFKEEEGRPSTVRLILTAVFMLGLPLAAGLAWVHYSDGVKALNPLSLELTSTHLSSWNYGPAALRLSVVGWCRYLFRTNILVFGPLGFLLFPLLITRWFRKPASRPALRITMAIVFALLAGPLVFTNLYFQHDYYALAGSAFAILLFSHILFLEMLRPRLLMSLLIVNLLTTALFIRMKQANYEDPLSDGLVACVAGLPPETNLIIFGSYLDARIPYESGHKALQSRIENPRDARLVEVLRRMEGGASPIIISRRSAFFAVAGDVARRFDCGFSRELAPGVRIWASEENMRFIKPQAIAIQPEYNRRIQGFDPSTALYNCILLPAGSDAAPGLGLKAYGNVYLFDFRRGLRVIHHRWMPAEVSSDISPD